MKRFLLLSLSGIGNYIMQSPAIAALKQQYPDSHITVWVAPKGTKPLAEADPNVDEVIQMPLQASVSQHMKQIFQLRRGRYDVGIVLSPGQLVKSAAYLFLAGIPQRIGHAYPFRGNPHSSFLLTDAITEQNDLHDVEQNLRLLEPLGVKVESSKNYVVSIPGADKQKGDELFTNLNIPTGKIVIGIHAGSSPELAFKRWPAERFAEVARSLMQNRNAHILLFGGPDEEEQKKKLQQLIGNNVSNISAPLLTTAAVMQHCKLMISNDSGLMHLAAAIGVSTVGLFGPTSEVLTGPRGPHTTVIRAPGTVAVYDTEKNPHLGREPHETILAITPQSVIQKIEELL